MKYERNEETALLFKELAKYPALSKEEEFELADKIQEGCERSLQKLVLHNTKFAIKEANRFTGQGLHLNDLIQEASIGMMNAAERFTRERNSKFITYAKMWIRKALNESLVEKGTIVQLPMNKAIENYKSKVKGDDVVHNVGAVKIDKPLSDEGGNTLGDILLHTSPEINQIHDNEELKLTVHNALETLGERDAAILKSMFGIEEEGGFGKSAEDIANEYGMTSTRVNQIVRKGKEQLEELLS
jgi:RNA polymerase primary sigma factor